MNKFTKKFLVHEYKTKSLYKIAKQLNTNYTMIYKLFIKYGIKRRYCSSMGKLASHFIHGVYIKHDRFCCDCNIKLTGHGNPKRCIKCANSGKNHPCYKDGKGREPYAFNFSPKLKLEIRKRDSFKCRFCGMTEEEHLKKYNRVLEVHHKDHNRKNSKKSNLITTCKKCNLGR
jgi:hypothetical protein